MPDPFIEVARFASPIEAAIARAHLEDHGVSTLLDGDAVASTLWHFGPAIAGVRLLVPAEDAERAAAMLEELSGDAEDVSEFADDESDEANGDSEAGLP